MAIMVMGFLNLKEIPQIEKMVYNGYEMKNGMTKERRCGLRHDVACAVFLSWCWLHYLTIM